MTSELGQRIMSGVVLAGIAVFAVMQGGWVFHLFMCLATTAMIWELFRITRGDATDGGEPFLANVLALLTFLALLVAALLPAPLTPIALLVGPVAGVLMLPRNRVIFTLYSLVIITTFAVFAALRLDQGAMPFFWIVASVAGADIAAYFTGRTLGGPKLAPSISPGKTWSGAVGGWIGAGMVSLGFAGSLNAPLVAMLAFGVAIGIASQMGDLGESALKRRFGVKDSSNLIPGHGGFLDRFDGMTGAAMVLLVLQVTVGLPFGAGI